MNQRGDNCGVSRDFDGVLEIANVVAAGTVKGKYMFGKREAGVEDEDEN